MRMMGRTVIPGERMSIRRKEMPSWRLSRLASVRTRQKIQSAKCACVVQIFWPVTT